MDYLEKYNLTKEEITKIRKRFNKDIVNKFELMENNVTIILDYLLSLEVSNFKEILSNRPDICFMKLEVLKEKIEKIDKELIKFIFDNEVENLINFDI